MWGYGHRNGHWATETTEKRQPTVPLAASFTSDCTSTCARYSIRDGHEPSTTYLQTETVILPPIPPTKTATTPAGPTTNLTRTVSLSSAAKQPYSTNNPAKNVHKLTKPLILHPWKSQKDMTPQCQPSKKPTVPFWTPFRVSCPKQCAVRVKSCW